MLQISLEELLVAYAESQLRTRQLEGRVQQLEAEIVRLTTPDDEGPADTEAAGDPPPG